ncbi:glycoside hydrolase family 2 protein [Candidatus Lokiarchaeum ossiferum]|uniref:glycoside hydrolase family 2 protein n=1 Tax=Candidatus Lokiarchaeum ossiferum TaxID=2951803 RepID=UPI00352E0913
MVGIDQKRIILSDSFWMFRFLKDDEEITSQILKEGLPLTEETLKVYVPSSWALYQNRKHFYHFGRGLYEMNFYLPYRWGSGDGKKVTLVFNGSNYKTTVWINGKKVGFHEGGYTKFWFEINDFVVFGKENRITIEVDNRYMENRLPWFESPEWMNYGGIFRPVYLKLTSQVCFDDFKITNDLEFDKPLGLGSQSCKAKLNVRFLVKDHSDHRKDFEGSIIAILKNSEELDSIEVPFKFEDKNERYVDISLNVENPHLWSPEDPYMHELTFQLIDKKDRKEIDREKMKWGIRDFVISGKNFYLNNKPIVLRGISRHEDHPDVGSSMNPRLIYNDLNIMKGADINCIRTSHYPPHESLLDFADEMGFLVLEEIPVYRLRKEHYTPEMLINAQQQLWEMIHRDKNKCSVIAWIVSSECDTESEEGNKFMSTLLQISRDLDPTRYHTLVTEKPLLDTTMDLVDFVCANVYIGWYDNYDVSPKDAAAEFDLIWKKMNTLDHIKPLMISEFGAGAISGFKSFANARWSENYQYDLLREYLDIIIDKDYINGACIWHFQDFRCSPVQGFHERPKEYNNKGIVDMHRDPKISYYIVQRRYEKWKKMIEQQNSIIQKQE